MLSGWILDWCIKFHCFRGCAPIPLLTAQASSLVSRNSVGSPFLFYRQQILQLPLRMMTISMTNLNEKRRYLAYFCIIFGCYVETSGRFGATMAMMPGRMVKEDCQDPNDTGELCWSKTTQALVLGSYFYGFTVQFIAVFIAKRFVGYLKFYRLYLIIGGISQLCYPKLAAISSLLVIITQGVRGFMASIMIAYSFRFIAEFSVKDENKVLLPLFGGTISVGLGTGGLIADAMYGRFGWRAYFYFTGAMYVAMLFLNLLFVHDNIEHFWYLTTAEKEIMRKVSQEAEPQQDRGRNTTDENQQQGQPEPTFRDIYCRVYLLAFCVYLMAHNLIYYNIYSVVPFFLNSVLKADPQLISYLNISLSVLMAVCMLILSFILKSVDKILPWLRSRLLFTLLPMMIQVALNLLLCLCTDIYSAITILTLSAICTSNRFAGSVGTLNYEIDPENSPLIVSVYNSAGQIPGFVGPLLMTAFTNVGPGAGDNEIRRGWTNYFIMVAGVAGSAIIAILAAIAVKPDEWVNRAQQHTE